MFYAHVNVLKLFALQYIGDKIKVLFLAVLSGGNSGSRSNGGGGGGSSLVVAVVPSS